MNTLPNFIGLSVLLHNSHTFFVVEYTELINNLYEIKVLSTENFVNSCY